MGRPTREETASTIIVTFRITQEEKRLLDEIASRRNASVSDVLRALIRKEAARLDPSRDER
ncbi:MAG TPA: ribbon-helix-helix protein, CopG family [Minicystis sp.]|nr:ribbon-helix-helix protein, CopG family [Minicystis sp.]